MAKKQAYKTPKHLPKCVKYWDKVFKGKPYFFDWQLIRSLVELNVEEVMSELEIPKKKARTVVWNAYSAAIRGDEDSPLYEDVQDFVEAIEESEMPLFVAYSSIRFDIHVGMSEREAKEAIVAWLKEDPENGIFGKYRLTTRLTVVRV